MSIAVMTAVWQRSAASGTDLLMLLALADFSDDLGNSYPAVETLATKCRMKPRNANYVLRALRESGELEVLQNQGPRGTNCYRIVLDRLGQGLQSSAGVGVQGIAGVQSTAGMQRIAQTPAKDCAKPLQPVADEPSLNRQEPSRTSRRGSEPLRTLSEWLMAIKAIGQQAVPEGDPVFTYATKANLPEDFLRLAWLEFRELYLSKDKRYRDWRGTFRNAVRGNWLKLWHLAGDSYVLTTAGEQAKRVHLERAA